VMHHGLQRLASKAYDPVWDAHLSAAKYYVTEQALEVGQTILRLTEGRGYESKYGFERYLRDVAGLISGSGAQDILAVDLGVWLVSGWEHQKAAQRTK